MSEKEIEKPTIQDHIKLLKRKQDFMILYKNISSFLLEHFPDKKIVIYDIINKEGHFEVFYSFISDNTKLIKIDDNFLLRPMDMHHLNDDLIKEKKTILQKEWKLLKYIGMLLGETSEEFKRLHEMLNELRCSVKFFLSKIINKTWIDKINLFHKYLDLRLE